MSLFVFDLGFIRFAELEKILHEKPYIFFEDFISETTSFVTYHYDYRFDYFFDHSFRMKFVKEDHKKPTSICRQPKAEIPAK